MCNELTERMELNVEEGVKAVIEDIAFIEAKTNSQVANRLIRIGLATLFNNERERG